MPGRGQMKPQDSPVAASAPGQPHPPPPASDSTAPTLQKQGPPRAGGWQSQQRGHAGGTSPAAPGASRGRPRRTRKSAADAPAGDPGRPHEFAEAGGSSGATGAARKGAEPREGLGRTPAARPVAGRGGRPPSGVPRPRRAPGPAPCALGACEASRWSWPGAPAARTAAGSGCAAGCCWRRRRLCG